MISIGSRSVLTILCKSYEFENAQDHWDDFININIEYSIEGKSVFNYSDPCFMTTELEYLTKSLNDFINSDDESITVDFIEPTIIISVKRMQDNEFSLIIEVNMNCGDYDVLKKEQRYDLREFEQLIIDIKSESKKFPPRF